MIKGLRAAGVYSGVSYETIRTWMKWGLPHLVDEGVTYFDPIHLAPFIERHKMRQLADQKIEPLRGRDPKRL